MLWFFLNQWTHSGPEECCQTSVVSSANTVFGVFIHVHSHNMLLCLVIIYFVRLVLVLWQLMMMSGKREQISPLTRTVSLHFNCSPVIGVFN